jgi:Tfp pilus assembly protein PilZ
MGDRSKIQRLMPLMREFGGLERKRVSEGVTPLEFQRCLDLKSQIGLSFGALGQADRSNGGSSRAGARATRLALSYKNRAALLAAIVENIQPAGFFVATPFAADVGTHFVVRITLEAEAESGEFPCVVVTSLTQGAHTLSTSSMGMALKIEKANPAQSAHVSRLFAGALDQKLRKTG